MEFYCVEKMCSFEGKKPFVLNIPTEMCVDEHNCATVFCPYCQSKLIKKEPVEPLSRDQ